MVLAQLSPSVPSALNCAGHSLWAGAAGMEAANPPYLRPENCPQEAGRLGAGFGFCLPSPPLHGSFLPLGSFQALLLFFSPFTLEDQGLHHASQRPHSCFCLSCLPTLPPCLSHFIVPPQPSRSASLVSCVSLTCCLRGYSGLPQHRLLSVLNICVFSTSTAHPALCLLAISSFHVSPHISVLPILLPIQGVFPLLCISRCLCPDKRCFSHHFPVSVSPHVSFLSSVSFPFPSCPVSFSSMALSESLSHPISLDGAGGRWGEVGLLLLGAH